MKSLSLSHLSIYFIILKKGTVQYSAVQCSAVHNSKQYSARLYKYMQNKVHTIIRCGKLFKTRIAFCFVLHLVSRSLISSGEKPTPVCQLSAFSGIFRCYGTAFYPVQYSTVYALRHSRLMHTPPPRSLSIDDKRNYISIGVSCLSIVM